MFDLYAVITDRLITLLESGVIPWQKPWTGTAASAISHVTGKPYSLLNQMLLRGRPGEYLTFKQCADEGGHVRKGEKSSMIVFWKWLEKEDEETGEKEQVPLLKYYSVFHISQCEGIFPRYSNKDQTQAGPVLAPDAVADAIVNGYVARSGVHLIVTRSNRAFYSPIDDTVTVPEISQYRLIAEYYSTLFHELTHSTGHPSRLNRLSGNASFGSTEYSKEELIAEIGSAYLVSAAGLECDTAFRNSAAYIQGWLKALKNDRRLIVTAAGKAEKAVQWILGETAGEEATADDAA